MGLRCSRTDSSLWYVLGRGLLIHTAEGSRRPEVEMGSNTDALFADGRQPEMAVRSPLCQIPSPLRVRLSGGRRSFHVYFW